MVCTPVAMHTWVWLVLLVYLSLPFCFYYISFVRELFFFQFYCVCTWLASDVVPAFVVCTWLEHLCLNWKVMFGVCVLLQLQVQVFVMVNGERDGAVEFSGLSRGWVSINRCVQQCPWLRYLPQYPLCVYRSTLFMTLTQLPKMPLFAWVGFSEGRILR